MAKSVAVIEGDGIGPEVIRATVDVLGTLCSELHFERFEAGDGALQEYGTALPDETLSGARKSDAVLLGAVGETAAEVVIRLRQELDTYVNLRPIKSYSGVESLYQDLDCAVVRENTEGLYAGIENLITEGVATATRVITERASRRIAEFAFEYAASEGYSKVTAIHKKNVLPLTDNLFLDTVAEVAEDYSFEFEEMLVDAAALHLAKNPDRFEVLVTTNLFGDILSDLGGGLIGGLGLCPSANIGDKHGLFEPVHGTAPDIAGSGQANPTAALVSGSYMLKFLGFRELGTVLEEAVEETIRKGETTPDLGGNLSTTEMVESIKSNLS